MLQIYDFSIDYVKFPDLIKCKNLRFAWKLNSNNSDVLQKNFQLTINEENSLIFDSGIIESSQFFNLSFNELVLKTKTTYRFNLKVTDNCGDTASISHTATTEINEDEWDALWIKPSVHLSGWAPYLRTRFEVTEVKKATMYAVGLGCAEYYINGECINDYLLDPPSANYDKTVFYRMFDVTKNLKNGGNALAVLLGENFYSQSRVWGYEGASYGDVCLKLRLEITLNDGSVKVITSNTEDWKYKYSPITVNNLYGGETYDCRLETPDFANFESNDNGWGDVIEDITPKGVLTPCLIPPIKTIRELPAINYHSSSGKNDGAWIFDIGENIAGIAEFKLPRSPKGAVYVFRFAETLNESGHLDYRSIGSFATQCVQQDIYICRGDSNGETYRPRFTYHGFRYVEVTGFHDFTNGYGTQPELSLVKGVQVSTDFDCVADFKCSHESLNKLYKVMKNTYVSNFHGHPEDCPAREKCGWLGDAHVVCDWGLLNYDTTACYEKYLNDIRTTYESFGGWRQVSPGLRACEEATPLWGCAQILIPYFLYKYSGDTKAITENFDLMELWISHELERSDDYIISEGLGDWCPPCGNDSPRRIPVKHSSTAIFYEICIRMEEICKIFNIGNADYYKSLAEKIKESFIRNFYNFEKHSYGYWGSNAVALETGLYPDGEYSFLLNSIIKMIKNDDYFMSTAIYTNKYIVPLLFKNGYSDVALRFLFNNEHPSFETMLKDGATTVYECIEAKGVTERAKEMPSLNHPMQGGFLYFLTTELCGLKPLKAGYSQVEFSPSFSSEIKEVEAEYNLISGKISVKISENSDSHICELIIPTGVQCKINLKGKITVDNKPYIPETVLGSGKHHIIIK